MKLARENTKMEQALEIFREVPGDDNHRKTVIARFIDELDMAQTTAGTYYTHCTNKILEAQAAETEAVIASKRARKYSAVKTKRGSNIAADVQVFFTKKAAEQFNESMFGYNYIVPGVQPVGEPVQTASKGKRTRTTKTDQAA